MYKGKLQYCIKKEIVVMYTLHKRNSRRERGLDKVGVRRGQGKLGGTVGEWIQTQRLKKAVNIFLSSTDDWYWVTPP